MSYAPHQDNPLRPSGIVYFGNPSTDQTFEASSNFVYDSTNNRIVVDNVLISNSGNIGSSSTPDAITILSDGDVTLKKDLLISGNLTVQGTQVVLNTETLAIEDNIVLLNKNVTGEPSIDAGLEVERGNQPNVSLIYDEGVDKWRFTNDGTTYFNIGSGVYTLSADNGTAQTLNDGDTLSILGGSGIITTIGATDTYTIDILVDNSTIEIVSDTVRVKDSGITNAKLATSSVTEDKVQRTIDSTFVNNEIITADINLVTGGVSGISVKLPAPVSGKMVFVKKIDSGAGPVTILRNSSETIDGATSKVLYYQYESLSFVSDGTNWYIV
jgi:hypothetical protein